MNDQIYKEIILEHWENPQNYGVITSPSLDISEANPLCGDEIRITAQITGNILTNIAFTAEGCAVSIASASIFIEEVKNKPIKEIKNMKPEFVLDLLGITLTPTRTKCALLVYSTLLKGLKK